MSASSSDAMDRDINDGDAGERARVAASRIADEARQAGETLRAHASDITQDVQDQVKEQAAAGKDQLGERLSTLAEHVKGSAGALGKEEAWLAGFVEQGATQLQEIGEALKSRDLDSLLGTLDRFGRERPALFAGAAVAAGFAAARFAMVNGGGRSPSGPGAARPSDVQAPHETSHVTEMDKHIVQAAGRQTPAGNQEGLR